MGCCTAEAVPFQNEPLLGFALSHPSRKNNNAARVGRPALGRPASIRP